MCLENRLPHPLFQAGANPPSECCGKPGLLTGRYFFFGRERMANTSNLWVIRDTRGGFLHRSPSVPITVDHGLNNLCVPQCRAGTEKKSSSRWGRSLGEACAVMTQSLSNFCRFCPAYRPTVAFSKDGQWVAYSSYPDGGRIVAQPSWDGTEVYAAQFSLRWQRSAPMAHKRKSQIACSGPLFCTGQNQSIFYTCWRTEGLPKNDEGDRDTQVPPNWLRMQFLIFANRSSDGGVARRIRSTGSEAGKTYHDQRLCRDLVSKLSPDGRLSLLLVKG